MPRHREFSEQEVRERAGNDLLDAIHSDDCVTAWAMGNRSIQSFYDMVDRLNYLESQHTPDRVLDRMRREEEDAFERGGSA